MAQPMLCEKFIKDLVSRKRADFRLNPPNFGKDSAGMGSPGKRLTVGVSVGDVILDRGDELFDWAECASTDRLTSDQARPDLDLVYPRHPDRCAMEGDVRIVVQSIAHLRDEMRTEVVDYHVDLEVNVVGGDLLHEGDKLLRSTPWIAFCGDFTRRDIQRPEQIDGAMPDVVVRALFRLIEGQGKQRLVRSTACTPEFSSHNTTAAAGGDRYRPTTSATFSPFTG